MIMPPKNQNILPLEDTVKRYGIPAERIREANQHYPEIVGVRSTRQLVYVNRLGAAEESSYEEMLEMGFKISPRFIESMQSWFNTHNLDLSLEPSKKVLIAKVRRYWEDILKATYKETNSRFFTGQYLYDNLFDFSKNGNPNGVYLRTEVRGEIVSNLELLGDIITKYSNYDIKKMGDGGLLREYKSTNSLAIRNELVERYMPLVKSLAKSAKYGISPSVQLDDLVSNGILRLIEAIEVYDSNKGIKFKTFAASFIRWGIKSEIRDTDMVPNKVRATAGKLRGAKNYLFSILGRQPDDSEMIEYLGVTEKKYGQMIITLQDASTRSLFSPITARKDVLLMDEIEDTREESPDARLSRKDMIDTIEQGLSRTEKLMLILYYGEEFSMKETGSVIGLAESRISQKIKEIKPILKDRINNNLHWEKDYFNKDVVLF